MNDSHDEVPPGGDATDFQRKLASDFADREYRESYAEESLKTSVAVQIQIIRDQRGWNQERLAKETGTTQSAISRLENANNSSWNIKTLLNTAFALGTRLHISFETFGSLIEQVESFSRGHLQRPSFEEDPKILRWSARAPQSAFRKLEEAGDPRAWMQRAVGAWLAKNDWPEQRVQLTNWLRGYGLPPVGPEEEPYAWLLYGLPLGTERPNAQKRFASLLGQLVSEQPDVDWRFEEREDALYNLFLLCAGMDWAETLADPLDAVLKRTGPDESLKVRDALLAALIRSQADARHESMWIEMIQGGTHEILPGDQYAGLSGIKWLPGPELGEPNLQAIAKGLKLMAEIHLNQLREPDRDEQFRSIVEQIIAFYGRGGEMAAKLQRLFRDAGALKWSRLVFDKLISPRVTITFPDGKEIEAKTDAEGEVTYIPRSGGEDAIQEVRKNRPPSRFRNGSHREFHGLFTTAMGNRATVVNSFG